MLMTIAGLTTLMAQQTHDIKGVVTDKRNEPIVGALVTAEGTDISSITDIDGKFLLRDVPVDAKKVIVESIGMETTDAKIDRPIMMAARPKRLSLVVEAGMDWSRYTAEGSDSKNGYHFGVGMECVCLSVGHFVRWCNWPIGARNIISRKDHTLIKRPGIR